MTLFACNATSRGVPERLRQRIDSNIGYVDCILLGDIVEVERASDHQDSARVKVTKVLWGGMGDAWIEVHYDRRFEAELKSPHPKILFLRRSEDEDDHPRSPSSETTELALAATNTWECSDVLTASATESTLHCSVLGERQDLGSIETCDLESTIQHVLRQVPMVDVTLMTTGPQTWGYDFHGTGAWENRGSTQSRGFANRSQVAAVEKRVGEWISAGVPTYIGQPGQSPDCETFRVRMVTARGAYTVHCSTAAWNAHVHGGPGTYEPFLQLCQALPGLPSPLGR